MTARARRASAPSALCATEHDEQCAVVEWSRLMAPRYPALELLYAVPNGGFRSRRTAGRMKAEGLRPGVPDLCLPVARGGWHGLYVELKRSAGGRLSPTQSAWHARLDDEGYRVAVCRGAEHAIRVIGEYLQITPLASPPAPPTEEP